MEKRGQGREDVARSGREQEEQEEEKEEREKRMRRNSLAAILPVAKLRIDVSTPGLKHIHRAGGCCSQAQIVARYGQRVK